MATTASNLVCIWLDFEQQQLPVQLTAQLVRNQRRTYCRGTLPQVAAPVLYSCEYALLSVIVLKRAYCICLVVLCVSTTPIRRLM
jgi:hypothetical protein